MDRISKAISKFQVQALRHDLEVSFISRGNGHIAIIKDPIAHSFYEIDPADWEVATHLDPELGTNEQIERLRKELPKVCKDVSDAILNQRIARISAELLATGLARGALKNIAPQKPDHDSLRQGALRFLSKISKLLFLRFRLLDPTRLLEVISGINFLFFNRWFLLLSLVLFPLAFIAFVLHGGLEFFDPKWFGSFTSLAALYFGTSLLKLLHEAAHAMAVKSFGGNVHEISMTLVAGLPIFHVEASDSYMFTKKSQRLAVSAAGIISELFAASLLICLWLVLADGFFRQLVTNLILIASVSTLLFNGNPLMRFDGYYILSDALEIPDLRKRANRYVIAQVEGFLTGKQTDISSKPGKSLLLGFYGVASQCYMVLVTFGIWRFLSAALDPYGLKWLGTIFVGAWGITSFVIPGVKTISEMIYRIRGSASESMFRVLKIISIGILLIVLVFIVPLPVWVDRECVIQPIGADSIHASEEGFLHDIKVKEGDVVHAGQILAVLQNHKIEKEYAKALTAFEQAETSLQSTMAEGKADVIGTRRHDIIASQSQLQQAKSKLDALQIASELEGVVASREMERRRGHLLKRGDVFCIVEPHTLVEFQINLNEKQARLVQKGTPLRIRLNAFPWRKIRGVVENSPLHLDSHSSDLPSIKEAQSDTHFITVRLNSSDIEMRIGMTGRVRIECGKQPLVVTLLDNLLDFLHLDVRMR